MTRRHFLHTAALSSAAASTAALVSGCGPLRSSASRPAGQVMTVGGPVDARDLGVTLAHEHAFADLRPYDEQARDPLDLDPEAVVAVVLPYLEEIRALGVRTFVDATAVGLGRRPDVLRRLAEASGLHVVTTTGAYLAAGGRFIPPYVRTASADALARRWVGEWERGIGGTDVRPGLVKIGVEGGPLTDLEATVVRAAARTHRETGLLIAAHVGPWGEPAPGALSASAVAQLDLLEAEGVGPSAWVWVHAQNEADGEQHVRAARRGAWVSFDGYRPGDEARYVALVTRMRDAGLLGRVLVSQDAGWYSADEPGGGDFAPYAPLVTTLVPALRRGGLGDAEVNALLVRNPAEALAIRTR